MYENWINHAMLNLNEAHDEYSISYLIFMLSNNCIKLHISYAPIRVVMEHSWYVGSSPSVNIQT